MTKIKLKSILRRNQGFLEVFGKLSEKYHEPIGVLDARKSLLFGNEESLEGKHLPIEWNGDEIGYVVGDDLAHVVRDLILQVVERELNEKKLGVEVLNLYREINLIYNFSEKIAHTIDPYSIGRLTLKEAMKHIQANGGLVILSDEGSGKLNKLCSINSDAAIFGEFRRKKSPLTKAYHAGQSQILGPDFLPNKGENGKKNHALLFVPLKVKNEQIGAILLHNHEGIDYTAADLKFLTTLAFSSASAIESALLYEQRMKEAEEREKTMKKIHEVTTRFVPIEFIQSLGRESLMDVNLGDQVEKVVTVVFADIRDYTSLSEQMTPEQNFQFVNAFNARLGPIIKKNNGFINQYLGDGMMAIFPGNPSEALMAAIDMQMAIQEYNAMRIDKSRRPIQIGIGMHTGPLIMGIIGDSDRMDAATISDTVNTAARIESLTKQYRSRIIFSAQTLKGINSVNGLNYRDLGMVQVKGKNEMVSIFECFDGDPETEKDRKLDTLDTFNKGIAYFFDEDYVKSTNIFLNVVDRNPGDKTAMYFAELAQKQRMKSMLQD